MNSLFQVALHPPSYVCDTFRVGAHTRIAFGCTGSQLVPPVRSLAKASPFGYIEPHFFDATCLSSHARIPNPCTGWHCNVSVTTLNPHAPNENRFSPSSSSLSVLEGPLSLKLSDTRVYEPQIRAHLRTGSRRSGSSKHATEQPNMRVVHLGRSPCHAISGWGD